MKIKYAVVLLILVLLGVAAIRFDVIQIANTDQNSAENILPTTTAQVTHTPAPVEPTETPTPAPESLELNSDVSLVKSDALAVLKEGEYSPKNTEHYIPSKNNWQILFRIQKSGALEFTVNNGNVAVVPSVNYSPAIYAPDNSWVGKVEFVGSKLSLWLEHENEKEFFDFKINEKGNFELVSD